MEVRQRAQTDVAAQGDRLALLNILADRVLPAQQYVPARSEAFFQATADTLNGSAIGVIFNSYDPKNGTGFLYGNDAARRALPTEKKIPNMHAGILARTPGQRDLPSTGSTRP